MFSRKKKKAAPQGSPESFLENLFSKDLFSDGIGNANNGGMNLNQNSNENKGLFPAVWADSPNKTPNKIQKKTDDTKDRNNSLTPPSGSRIPRSLRHLRSVFGGSANPNPQSPNKGKPSQSPQPSQSPPSDRQPQSPNKSLLPQSPDKGLYQSAAPSNQGSNHSTAHSTASSWRSKEPSPRKKSFLQDLLAPDVSAEEEEFFRGTGNISGVGKSAGKSARNEERNTNGAGNRANPTKACSVETGTTDRKAPAAGEESHTLKWKGVVAVPIRNSDGTSSADKSANDQGAGRESASGGKSDNTKKKKSPKRRRRKSSDRKWGSDENRDSLKLDVKKSDDVKNRDVKNRDLKNRNTVNSLNVDTNSASWEGDSIDLDSISRLNELVEEKIGKLGLSLTSGVSSAHGGRKDSYENVREETRLKDSNCQEGRVEAEDGSFVGFDYRAFLQRESVDAAHAESDSEVCDYHSADLDMLSADEASVIDNTNTDDSNYRSEADFVKQVLQKFRTTSPNQIRRVARTDASLVDYLRSFSAVEEACGSDSNSDQHDGISLTLNNPSRSLTNSLLIHPFALTSQLRGIQRPLTTLSSSSPKPKDVERSANSKAADEMIKNDCQEKPGHLGERYSNKVLEAEQKVLWCLLERLGMENERLKLKLRETPTPHPKGHETTNIQQNGNPTPNTSTDSSKMQIKPSPAFQPLIDRINEFAAGGHRNADAKDAQSLLCNDETDKTDNAHASERDLQQDITEWLLSRNRVLRADIARLRERLTQVRGVSIT
jgi:hypothetical protein